MIAKKTLQLLCLILFLPHFSFAKNTQANNYILIGTGSVNGIYYPIGKVICKILNADTKLGTRCFHDFTSGKIYNFSGSLDNLIQSRSKKVDLAISQNDWLYYSYSGEDLFAKIAADKHLRTIITLHTESVVVIVKDGVGIETFNDLKGRVISVGYANSSTNLTMAKIFKAANFTKADLNLAKELKPSEEMAKFCSGEINAMFIVFGNPNIIANEMIKCGGKVISLPSEIISNLSKEHPFYVKTILPIGIYGNKTEIETIGIKSSLFTRDDMDEKLIYNITKDIILDIKSLSASHEALKGVSKNTIVRDVVIPFHNGSLKYFKEAGLIKSEKTE